MIFERTRIFPKYHRPTLGRRFEENAIDLTISTRMVLFTAKDDHINRMMHIDKISQNVDHIRIIAQMAVDLKIMKPEPYTQICELVAEIGKEIGGFKKYSKKLAGSSKPPSGSGRVDTP